jgi:hypothetical protein
MAANVRTWPENSLERKAYNAVDGIPFVEMNDGNRLGYHVFLYLKGELDSIEQAVHVAQARMHIGNAEAVTIITRNLEKSDTPAPAAEDETPAQESEENGTTEE